MEKEKKYYQIPLRIPESIKKRIKMHAADKDLSVNKWIQKAIEEKLERDSKRPRI